MDEHDHLLARRCGRHAARRIFEPFQCARESARVRRVYGLGPAKQPAGRIDLDSHAHAECVGGKGRTLRGAPDADGACRGRKYQRDPVVPVVPGFADIADIAVLARVAGLAVVRTAFATTRCRAQVAAKPASIRAQSSELRAKTTEPELRVLRSLG